MLSFNPTKIKLVSADGLIPYLLSENDNSTTECPLLLALPVKQVQPDCYLLTAGPLQTSIVPDSFRWAFSLLMPSLGSSCIRSCLNLFIDETFSHSRLTVATFVCVRWGTRRGANFGIHGLLLLCSLVFYCCEKISYKQIGNDVTPEKNSAPSTACDINWAKCCSGKGTVCGSFTSIQEFG